MYLGKTVLTLTTALAFASAACGASPTTNGTVLAIGLAVAALWRLIRRRA